MMSVTDTNAAGGKRPGRPRKDDKRAALSLRVNPELRRRLVAMAEENGRSITQQTELLLEHAVNGLDRGGSPLEPKRASFNNSRLRSALKLELEAAAKDHGRSLSEEIEFRLERSLDPGDGLAGCLTSLGIWSFGIGGKVQAAYQEFHSICMATLASPGPRRRPHPSRS
jgi:hypothetical protein